MPVAFRTLLRHIVNIQRNTTVVSDTGATSFSYATVPNGSNVRCDIQDAGGRLRQDEVGQIQGRRVNIVFGHEWVGKLQQNDLIIVIFPVSQTYRLTHIRHVIREGFDHVECTAEQRVPSGGD